MTIKRKMTNHQKSQSIQISPCRVRRDWLLDLCVQSHKLYRCWTSWNKLWWCRKSFQRRKADNRRQTHTRSRGEAMPNLIKAGKKTKYSISDRMNVLFMYICSLIYRLVDWFIHSFIHRKFWASESNHTLGGNGRIGWCLCFKPNLHNAVKDFYLCADSKTRNTFIRRPRIIVNKVSIATIKTAPYHTS